jgi:hypothetical protein
MPSNPRCWHASLRNADPTAPVVIAVLQARRGGFQQLSEALLPLDQRQLHQILAVEEQQIEEEIDQRGRVAGLGGVLDDLQGGGAIGAQPTQLAIRTLIFAPLGARPSERHGRAGAVANKTYWEGTIRDLPGAT